jgi:hypothetical protein
LLEMKACMLLVSALLGCISSSHAFSVIDRPQGVAQLSTPSSAVASSSALFSEKQNESTESSSPRKLALWWQSCRRIMSSPLSKTKLGALLFSFAVWQQGNLLASQNHNAAHAIPRMTLRSFRAPAPAPLPPPTPKWRKNLPQILTGAGVVFTASAAGVVVGKTLLQSKSSKDAEETDPDDPFAGMSIGIPKRPNFEQIIASDKGDKDAPLLWKEQLAEIHPEDYPEIAHEALELEPVDEEDSDVPLAWREQIAQEKKKPHAPLPWERDTIEIGFNDLDVGDYTDFFDSGDLSQPYTGFNPYEEEEPIPSLKNKPITMDDLEAEVTVPEAPMAMGTTVAIPTPPVEVESESTASTSSTAKESKPKSKAESKADVEDKEDKDDDNTPKGDSGTEMSSQPKEEMDEGKDIKSESKVEKVEAIKDEKIEIKLDQESDLQQNKRGDSNMVEEARDVKSEELDIASDTDSKSNKLEVKSDVETVESVSVEKVESKQEVEPSNTEEKVESIIEKQIDSKLEVDSSKTDDKSELSNDEKIEFKQEVDSNMVEEKVESIDQKKVESIDDKKIKSIDDKKTESKQEVDLNVDKKDTDIKPQIKSKAEKLESAKGEKIKTDTNDDFDTEPKSKVSAKPEEVMAKTAAGVKFVGQESGIQKETKTTKKSSNPSSVVSQISTPVRMNRFFSSLLNSKNTNNTAAAATSASLPKTTSSSSLKASSSTSPKASSSSSSSPISVATVKKAFNGFNRSPLNQPRSAYEEAELQRKYSSIESLEERAFQILVDLGMIEVNGRTLKGARG